MVFQCLNGLKIMKRIVSCDTGRVHAIEMSGSNTQFFGNGAVLIVYVLSATRGGRVVVTETIRPLQSLKIFFLSLPFSGKSLGTPGRWTDQLLGCHSAQWAGEERVNLVGLTGFRARLIRDTGQNASMCPRTSRGGKAPWRSEHRRQPSFLENALLCSHSCTLASVLTSPDFQFCQCLSSFTLLPTLSLFQFTTLSSLKVHSHRMKAKWFFLFRFFYF